MFTNRVWREGDRVISITIRENSRFNIGFVLVEVITKHRSSEPCGYDYNSNYWRISTLHGRGYSERWGTDYKAVIKNVPYDYAKNIITRYFEWVRHAKSDTDEIVELAEMIKITVNEDLEGVKHEN